MGWAARHRYLLLLTVLIVTQAGMALLGPGAIGEAFAFDLLFTVAVLATLAVVFPPGRARRIGTALLVPAIVTTALAAMTGGMDVFLGLAFHASVVAFLGYAVAVVLNELFARRTVSTDEVLGAFAGYMLVAVLWGNLYCMVYLLAPDAFTVAPGIRWELGDWHQRRALFNFLSFATVSSLGYADVTTVAPIANTLAWLEVMTGQFYMAVVIATLVGIKVSQALGPERRP